jgi:hypothetical protein
MKLFDLVAIVVICVAIIFMVATFLQIALMEIYGIYNIKQIYRGMNQAEFERILMMVKYGKTHNIYGDRYVYGETIVDFVILGKAIHGIFLWGKHSHTRIDRETLSISQIRQLMIVIRKRQKGSKLEKILD